MKSIDETCRVKGFRKIVVAGETYIWKRRHFHPKKYEFQQCVEKIIVYLIDHKKSPLQLTFKDDKEEPKYAIGSTGILRSKELIINLNRPGVIAKLIEYFLKNGWNPKVDQNALIVDKENALELLDTVKLPSEQ